MAKIEPTNHPTNQTHTNKQKLTKKRRHPAFHLLLAASLITPRGIVLTLTDFPSRLRVLNVVVYRVSQEEWTKLRESVPYVKIYRYNPKYLNQS